MGKDNSKSETPEPPEERLSIGTASTQRFGTVPQKPHVAAAKIQRSHVSPSQLSNFPPPVPATALYLQQDPEFVL